MPPNANVGVDDEVGRMQMVDCRKGPVENRRLLRAVLPEDARRSAQNIADQSADRSGGGKPELERRNLEKNGKLRNFKVFYIYNLNKVFLL
jgi:hypothetical protein